MCVRVCVCQNMKDKAGPNLSGDGAPKLGTVPAGAVQAELARPLDASDISTPVEAVAEVVRLRQLMSAASTSVAADPATTSSCTATLTTAAVITAVGAAALTAAT